MLGSAPRKGLANSSVYMLAQFVVLPDIVRKTHTAQKKSAKPSDKAITRTAKERAKAAKAARERAARRAGTATTRTRAATSPPRALDARRG